MLTSLSKKYLIPISNMMLPHWFDKAPELHYNDYLAIDDPFYLICFSFFSCMANQPYWVI